ncbi:hypothetical protein KOAAANKH_00749 [Brevundimonas sp. NIBR10]|uniref:DUF3299 domain-containing protein n=1 Tax=Brevundimonas sp. NIBR10 TaxID=3015997 RepID=UPI0022F14860|nr:DUF3299 domain-containing protein [Brevundimonas sp. NIBR10]WGM45884.1 hypothetical protein KOAAANKH_00749 [Brevundimonas sp. NIBR10]
MASRRSCPGLFTLAVAGVMATAACHPTRPREPSNAPRAVSAEVTAQENAAIDAAVAPLREDARLSDLPVADDGFGGPEGAAEPLAGGGPPAEIAGERIQQSGLPQSHDREWAVLRTTRIGIDKDGYYTAAHSPQVRALAGTRLTISGFMVPLEATDTTRHFLISPYTPVCFFCPPGDPNEVIEVRTARPVRSGYSLLRISGRFGLANNADKGLFFTLDDSTATVLRQVSADY